MITLRRSEERGHANHGWLESYHTFSFARYYDPRFSGFRDLLVINQDRVAPGRGFGLHPHDNMEIISYVLEGAIEHRDTMGSSAVLRPGEVQVISAGTGMAHSEQNASPTAALHFLQVWIVPNANDLEPLYQQKAFPLEVRQNALCLVCSPDGRDGSLAIRQDAAVYASVLETGQEIRHRFAPGRYGWIHVARGSITLDGQRLEDGDGASMEEEQELNLRGERNADLLLFDLP
ncbi:MAG: pirin family protein [Chloroflexota bacterium]